MEKENNIEFEYKGHRVVVSSPRGTESRYYWDKNFFIIIDKLPYIMFEVGSANGWISKCNTLKQVSLDYLECRKKENNEYYNDYCYNAISILNFNQSLFELLFDFMVENNANEVSQDECNKLTVIGRK